MSNCENTNPCEERVQIIQGEKRVFTVKILDNNDVGKDLTGVGEILAYFASETSGTYIEKKKSDVVDPIEVIAGTSNVKITLSATQTSDLKPGKGQTFFLVIDFPGDTGRKAFKLEKSYDVIEAPAFAAAP